MPDTTLVAQLNALGQDTRMNIVRFLCESGEQRFQAIATHVQLYQGLYYHLKLLKEAGVLVTRKVDSKRVVYSVSTDVLNDVCAGLQFFIHRQEDARVVEAARTHL